MLVKGKRKLEVLDRSQDDNVLENSHKQAFIFEMWKKELLKSKTKGMNLGKWANSFTIVVQRIQNTNVGSAAPCSQKDLPHACKWGKGFPMDFGCSSLSSICDGFNVSFAFKRAFR